MEAKRALQMRWKLEDLPDHMRRQVASQIAAENRAARSAAKREQDTGHEPVAEEETPGSDGPASFAGPVRIQFYDYRKRLTDSDNGWTKYIVDSIVSCGVLPDDDTSVIPERPGVRQVKAKEEKVVVEVWEHFSGEGSQ